jgi:hypothetical protein
MLRVLLLSLKNFFNDLWNTRYVEVAKGEFLPINLPERNFVIVRDGKEDWSVGFICPCGCHRKIELLLITDTDPHWIITVDSKKRPTLYPSIWLKNGCRSHFWVKRGKIVWV